MLAEIEAEREVLQTLWEETVSLGPERGRSLLERLRLVPQDFTVATARRLYQALCEAVASGRIPVLGREDTAGNEYLHADRLLNPLRMDGLSEGLKSTALRRDLQRAAREVASLALETELTSPELVERARATLSGIEGREGNWKSLSEAIGRVETHVREVGAGRKAPCVPSGFAQIDEATGGFPATLVVIVAMPGVGKSAWVGAVLRNLAHVGIRAAIFSMEDNAEWLAFRFLARESGVHQGALRRHPLSPQQWDAFGRAAADVKALSPLVMVDEREGLTPAQVLSASRDAIYRGAKIIFLDNMTAMRLPRGERRDLEFQDFLCNARALANETGVPFVVISHAKRREGLDVDQLPLLTDCAESSAFEKLCRLAYGLSRKRDSNTLTVAVLKNTNGRAWDKFDLELRPETALAEEPSAKPWDWSREVHDGDGTL